ncbi:MAG: hypothetical protein AB7G93_21350 [Bdellovibrionales bacterium]
MGPSRWIESKSIHVMSAIGLAAIFTTSFQSCSGVGFNEKSKGFKFDQNTLNAFMDPATATTKKNKPVTFPGGKINGSYQGTLSLAPTPGVSFLKSANGTFKIVDAVNFTIEYMPDESFVGTDETTAYATDAYGNAIPGTVKVVVGNTLNLLEPALAVRGLACIACHANISSNVIADYGFGDPWYFDTTSADSFYAERLGATEGLATIRLHASAKFFVPPGSVPDKIKADFSVNSLYEFVKARFIQGGKSSSTQVQEIKALSINVPSESRIREVFHNPTGVQKYIPDTQNSPALSGLSYDSTNKVFKITNLTCDGDLFLGATVVFSNAKVKSVNGCRIYATGSIFVIGNLTSSPYEGSGSTTYNTQLLSSRSIWMGVGKLYKDGRFCERDSGGSPVGWYYKDLGGGSDCRNAANAGKPRCDSFNMRASGILNRNTFSNGYPTANDLKGLFNQSAFQGSDGTIAKERRSVEAALGSSLYDASCEPQARAISFSRLLVAAPYINSRYNGDFSGAIVSDAALMSLGTFKFEFAPVFKSVSIFSLLDSNELISATL